jgi:hypothetical protein
MTWQPDASVDALVATATAPFGSCADDVGSAVNELTRLETTYLFDQRLAAYVQGEDAVVDRAYGLGKEMHPKRVAYEAVVAMDEGARAAFEASVVVPLEAFAAAIAPLASSTAARCRGMREPHAHFCEELADGMSVVELRAEHAAHTYRAILAHARGTSAADELAAARDATARAQLVVARRETHYRFDRERVAGVYANATSYPFGYLHRARTMCLWTRREAEVQAIVANGAPAAVTSLPTCDGE